MFCRHVFGNISGGFCDISCFLWNFAGFRGNTRILRVRNRAKYQKPCVMPFNLLHTCNSNELFLTIIAVPQAVLYSSFILCQRHLSFGSCFLLEQKFGVQRYFVSFFLQGNHHYRKTKLQDHGNKPKQQQHQQTLVSNSLYCQPKYT